MTSTCQANPNKACSGSVNVQATSADAFVDTEGTLFDPEGRGYEFDKRYAMEAGFRHVRSGAASSLYVARVKDLANAGLKTQLVTSPQVMYSPDPAVFWSAKGQKTSLVDWLITAFGHDVASIIDVIEGPNELDIEWHAIKWHPTDAPGTTICPTNNCGQWLGAYGVAYQRALYKAIKSNSYTARMKVIGPAPGTSFTSPFAVESGGGGTDLQGAADWGGCHPYATAGNGNGVAKSTYDDTSYYYGYTIAPAQEVDFAPRAWDQCNSSTKSGRGTVYGSIPLAPSEQGFFTGSGKGAVSEDIQARYYPRIYTEMYRHGMPRTITYRFDDFGASDSNPEGRFGLVRYDHSLKPAYFAMKSLNELLMEPGASFKPETLTYSVSVGSNGPFNRTQYMHDLLLQKSDGDFYLLFWHEIADAKIKNDDGTTIRGPAVELHPLSLPVTLTFPPNIVSAQLYTYDSGYKLIPQTMKLSDHKVSVSATDKVSLLRLSKRAFKTTPNQRSGSARGIKDDPNKTVSAETRKN
jgi:hypothetical protein